MLNLVIIALSSYLAGSFPTAILVGKLSRGIDIRQHGSGNAGGTNVFRVLGWKLGVFVMLVDMLKGYLATVYLSQLSFFPGEPINPVYFSILAGVFAIIGHIWTVFAGFKGGKGVGTAAGFLFGLIPVAALGGMVIFFTLFFIFRYVSLGSVCAAIGIPSILILQKFTTNPELEPVLIYITSAIAILIIYTHRSNIQRLLNGTENKITSLKGGNATK
ncbi:MAG: glycerol-3-phosphate 1-O-acyltransferase PlsY [Bacteroidetes bacterium]|nr:glycerol-3-phosphate 1-O-acyltransferase PlsY [Bacteroidota bacterium]